MLAVIFSQILRLHALQRAAANEGGKNRRLPRLYTSLPIEYSVFLPDRPSQLSKPATLKNIGKDGAYLECDSHPGLSIDQVVHFSFKSLSSSPHEPGSVHLSAKAIVCSIDRSRRGNFPFGVAVEFLSGPFICYHN